MHVLDVALCDQPKTVVNAANALTAWYWHVKKVPFVDADYELATDLLRTVWARFAVFERFGASMATWKMHCATEITTTVKLYGSFQNVSTDAYERAHKVHKAVFLRYALADFRVRCYGIRVVIK